ncbi:hypothetical protein M0638_25960 [Roseomonas sp. NAR14]|uniref:Uncharacterized protein n=1 Tax=Roseomonas acroporae TaxID=2937791 RepID=A0A9X1YCU9_9PROT|nr:hypothetical protein [Roseomonas acroporae]MCK8787806.1 hypothetical protein [Roseomonas acroporae]
MLNLLLFLLPFAAYALWRHLNPRVGMSGVEVALAVLGIVLAVGGAAWFGLSRSMAPDTVYVPPHLQDGRVVPGHAVPVPDASPTAPADPATRVMTGPADPAPGP